MLKKSISKFHTYQKYRSLTLYFFPDGIALYAERILAAWPPKINFKLHSDYKFPCYEARVMAIIIVTMKILFGLDGVTENEMSRVIERINL